MPINRLNITLIDNENIRHPICQLSFVESNRDLYFIDKSNDNFHISIHKDGNVFMTFQKDWEGQSKVKIFKFNWDLLEVEIEKEKPFLLYLPTSKSKYPIENKTKSRTATIYLENIDAPNSLMFKYFIISQYANNPKSKITDLGMKIVKLVGTKSNGQTIEMDEEAVNSSMRFNNHRIRFSIGHISKSKENADFRMLFLFQPTTEVDFDFFIRNNLFEIDLNHIMNAGYFLKRFKTKGNNEITLIAY